MKQKVRNVLEKGRYAVNAAAIGVVGSVMRTQTLLAGNDAPKLSDKDNNIVKTAIDQIIKLFPLVGAFFVVAGFFKLIMAYRSDNPEGQTGAAKDIVIGAVFIAFTIFWTPLSNIIFGNAGTGTGTGTK